MKTIKFIVCALLVFGLVDCVNSANPTDNNHTSDKTLDVLYMDLFNEYGADGTIVFCKEYLDDGPTELFPAYMGRIDASYYEAVKAAVNAITFTTEATEEAGTLIARVDIKKGTDMMYLNVYDNGVVGVRKHPEEVFFQVSQDVFDALTVAICDSYVAYEAFKAGN